MTILVSGNGICSLGLQRFNALLRWEIEQNIPLRLIDTGLFGFTVVFPRC